MSQVQEPNEEQEDTSTDLNLNTDIVHNRTTTYTSLSELYGVQLFTDKRLLDKQNYEANMNLKEKNVADSIFINKLATKDIDNEIIGVLFQEPLVIVKKQDYSENTTTSRGIFIVGAVIISAIFIIILTRYIKSQKKHRRGDKL